jgi:ACDE family multidrug resistance protein
VQALNYKSFIGFFFVQTLSRGILLSVIPLQALELVNNVQHVSVLFFTVSLGGIVTALATPTVIRQVGLYRTFLLAIGTMVLSLIALASFDAWLFTLGLFLHIVAIAAAEVVLSLYVLDRVPRRDLLRFEPWRMLFTILALTIGPFLGVFLQSRAGHSVPFIIGGMAVVGTLVHFHILGLQHTILKRTATGTTNPLHYIGRFFRQPRLRLAYGLTLARSSWWAMFVIYVPIIAKQTGLGELMGAGIVSIGTAWTLTVPLWGWVGRHFGLRYLVGVGFLATSTLSLLAFAYASTPVLAAGLIVFGALGASMLDGAGNVLFLRAVRTFERSEMAAVYATYRDGGQLVTPGLFAVLLKFFALPIVFASASVWMLAAAWFCRYIPKSMR